MHLRVQMDEQIATQRTAADRVRAAALTLFTALLAIAFLVLLVSDQVQAAAL